MNQAEFGTFIENEREQLVRLAESVTHNRDDAEDAVQRACLYLWERFIGAGQGKPLVLVTPSFVKRHVVNRAQHILQSRQSRREVLYGTIEDLEQDAYHNGLDGS